MYLCMCVCSHRFSKTGHFAKGIDTNFVGDSKLIIICQTTINIHYGNTIRG